MKRTGLVDLRYDLWMKSPFDGDMHSVSAAWHTEGMRDAYLSDYLKHGWTAPELRPAPLPDQELTVVYRRDYQEIVDSRYRAFLLLAAIVTPSDVPDAGIKLHPLKDGRTMIEHHSTFLALDDAALDQLRHLLNVKGTTS